MPYQALLDAVARVVGGTQPDAAHASVPAERRPYWFSGVDTGDSSGVAGLAGCWSVPTEQVTSTPVGMVFVGPWRPDPTMQPFPVGGHKYTEDEIHVRVMVGHDASQTLIARLVNFRDTVPPAFEAHMQLLGTSGVTSAWCNEGDFIEMTWGGNVYFALTFIVRVARGLNVTYVG
jgi:hypothetical protein